MRRKALLLVSMMTLAIGASLFPMAAVGHADTITITDIIVKVGDTTWCGKGSGVVSADPCFIGTHNIWSASFGVGGIVLAPGASLILTQTGGINNFDTSENAGGVGGGSGVLCNTTGLSGSEVCATSLKINTASGGGTVALIGADKDNLADRNLDVGGGQHNEAHDWGSSVGTVPNFGGFGAVYFGYADNLHGDKCLDAVTICLPNNNSLGTPVNLFDGTFGSTKSTVFIGQGSTIGKNTGQTQNPSGQCDFSKADSLCYDAGAILIYNTQPVPEPVTMFLGGTGLLLLAYAARKRLFAR